MPSKSVIPEKLEEAIETAGLKMQAYTSSHADALKELPMLVRHNSFDRMLLASAKSEGIRLLTSHKRLLDLKMDYIISASL